MVNNNKDASHASWHEYCPRGLSNVLTRRSVCHFCIVAWTIKMDLPVLFQPLLKYFELVKEEPSGKLIFRCNLCRNQYTTDRTTSANLKKHMKVSLFSNSCVYGNCLFIVYCLFVVWFLLFCAVIGELFSLLIEYYNVSVLSSKSSSAHC